MKEFFVLLFLFFVAIGCSNVSENNTPSVTKVSVAPESQQTPETSTHTLIDTHTSEEMFYKGIAHYSNQNYEQASFWIQKSASGGFAQAQHVLCGMYQVGRWVVQSDKQAFYWCEQAAKQGHADAEYQLGKMHFLKYSYTQALHWFEKGVKQDHAYSQFALGSMYYLGLGVDKDDEQALHWLLKAAGQGVQGAERIIAAIVSSESSESPESTKPSKPPSDSIFV